MSDVIFTRNDKDMSVNMIYDNCTVVVSANQRLGLWKSDYLITLGFKMAIDRFRTTESGKSVESAAFRFINTGAGIKYEPIPESFNLTSHDYYMNK